MLAVLKEECLELGGLLESKNAVKCHDFTITIIIIIDNLKFFAASKEWGKIEHGVREAVATLMYEFLFLYYFHQG